MKNIRLNQGLDFPSNEIGQINQEPGFHFNKKKKIYIYFYFILNFNAFIFEMLRFSIALAYNENFNQLPAKIPTLTSPVIPQ